jgi:hypothetical protein
MALLTPIVVAKKDYAQWVPALRLKVRANAELVGSVGLQ